MAAGLINSSHLTPVTRSPGGQRQYTQEAASAVLKRLESGDSLRAICREPGMPSETSVRSWYVDDYMGFAAFYARARNIGLDSRAERLLEIGRDATRDPQCRRVEIETEKWLLSKQRPEIYGDRTQVDHKLHWDGDISKLDEGQLAKLIMTLEQVVATREQAALAPVVDVTGEALAGEPDEVDAPGQPLQLADTE